MWSATYYSAIVCPVIPLPTRFPIIPSIVARPLLSSTFNFMPFFDRIKIISEISDAIASIVLLCWQPIKLNKSFIDSAYHLVYTFITSPHWISNIIISPWPSHKSITILYILSIFVITIALNNVVSIPNINWLNKSNVQPVLAAVIICGDIHG